MIGTLYILTGPSGAGKSTVAARLLSERPSLKKAVTYTSRLPREGEVPDVDYHFVSEDAFRQMIDRGEMFEWAEVYGKYYGSRAQDIEQLLASGTDVLMVIDVQGAREIKKDRPDAEVIFLLAESPEVLLERLERRDHGATEGLEERKRALQDEMAFSEGCEHRVLNREGRIEDAVREIIALMEAAP